jgi:hypothetical protein
MQRILFCLVNQPRPFHTQKGTDLIPDQGQGGGQAIEDAASLAVVLGRGTPRDEIPERLKLYEKCRYERAHRIQHYTRMAGRDAAEIASSGQQLNSQYLFPNFIVGETLTHPVNEYTSYNFAHDEWHHSTHQLKKWINARNPNVYWRMPTSFGPMPGPRQTIRGHSHNGSASTFTTSTIKFKTSLTYLQNLLPTSSFTFWTPGTIAYASLTHTTLSNMSWLGGGGYSHLGLYIHGIQYTKTDASILRGTFLAVLFENLTDPIVTGREELGMPKLYCALDSYRRHESLRIKASWQGANFGDLEWEGLEKEIEAPASAEGGISRVESGIPGFEGSGIFTYRYIPAVGEPGKADAEYPVFIPNAGASETPKVHTTWRAKKASFAFEGRDWDSLPTLHHIAAALGEIPILEVVEAKIVEGSGVPDVGQARRVE